MSPKRPAASPSGTVPAMPGPQSATYRVSVADDVLRAALREHGLVVGRELEQLEVEKLELQRLLAEVLVALERGPLPAELHRRARGAAALSKQAPSQAELELGSGAAR